MGAEAALRKLLGSSQVRATRCELVGDIVLLLSTARARFVLAMRVLACSEGHIAHTCLVGIWRTWRDQVLLNNVKERDVRAIIGLAASCTVPRERAQFLGACGVDWRTCSRLAR